MYRKDIILAMGAVEGEYRCASFALEMLLRNVRSDPRVLADTELTGTDLRMCRRSLESTYFVRMFAVFEEALRDVRRVVYRRRSPIRTHDLIQQCAARQHVRYDDLLRAHRVREHRNTIVHGGKTTPIPLPQARQWLCTFFGWMPPQW
jgi:hypothetical protein